MLLFQLKQRNPQSLPGQKLLMHAKLLKYECDIESAHTLTVGLALKTMTERDFTCKHSQK